MRSAIVLTSVALSVLAAVACATSNDETPPPPKEEGPKALPDGSVEEDAAPDSAPPVVPTCSDGGWCSTTLPDTDLTLKDIWPFEASAFAIAESESLGVKVLAWDEATRLWSYIDDNTQNSFAFDSHAGKIWAPSENELYFGAGPGFIYHGKRSAKGSPWSWERSQLDDNGHDANADHGYVEYWNPSFQLHGAAAIGVWGTSADDVYAWYANTIFHWKSADGGAPAWVPEYVADDVDNESDTFFVFGASGSGPDDVWFGGGRGRYVDWNVLRCPLAIHKTGGVYQRVVDNVINEVEFTDYYTDTCLPKDGSLSFEWTTTKGDTGPWSNGGFLTNIEAAGPGRAVGIVGEDRFAYVESGGKGLARVNRVSAKVPRDALPSLVNSVWVHDTETWLSGWGMVLRTPNDPAKWSTGLGLFTLDDVHDLGIDAAAFSFSPTAINGAPLDTPLNQVRGTSNTNLWAIGLHYALHKTTP